VRGQHPVGEAGIGLQRAVLHQFDSPGTRTAVGDDLVAVTVPFMARQLFAEHGYFQTKVEQIAKLSRVSPATVYAQCGGKQGLLRSLMDSWTETPAVVESYQESIAADDAVLVMQTLSAAHLQITRQWGDVIRVVIEPATCSAGRWSVRTSGCWLTPPPRSCADRPSR
jgi:Bacterial regulatory proteins, tetR family